ncbi:MAG: hypothetical protein II007_09505 [Gammaproteobacteria bacterium]|nr:hypothetical protein [Gammaproteobacteria bacterium]
MPENASLAGGLERVEDSAIDTNGFAAMHDLASPRFTPTIQCRRVAEPARRLPRRVQLVAAPTLVGRDWHQHRIRPAKAEARSVWPLLLPLLVVALVGSWLAP